MKVVKGNNVEKRNMTDQPLFEGGKVFGQLGFFEDAKSMGIGVVTFERGAVTKLHTHDFEQMLFVIAGKGRVATEKEEIIVSPGDFVYFPPGEKHLHGATKDSRFVQLTMHAGQHSVMYTM
jgi:quercetin dioxygenase-like cupin family protein